MTTRHRMFPDGPKVHARLEEADRDPLLSLGGSGEESVDSASLQRAMLNLLEDLHEDRCQYEDIQRALLNMLDDIDTERTRAEVARAKLEDANRELESFSYSVSHDLRAPLRAISGFSEAMAEDCASQLDAEGQRYLSLIQQNAHQMGQLIDDLLAFSRLSRQEVNAREIDLASMGKAVFQELAAEVPERAIEFVVASMPPAHADGALLRQVLANLLSNAIKFTRPMAHARIEFGYSAGPTLGAYYVMDNGVGFDMRYADKLFGVFQRLHPATDFEGTGVGLALVHRIISRHGGRVWAESALDRGATFFFSLPPEEDRKWERHRRKERDEGRDSDRPGRG